MSTGSRRGSLEMAALTLRMFLLIVHLPLVGGLAVDAISGDPVQFPETEQSTERGATLQHPVTGGSSQAVAPLEDAWKPAAGYKDRMSPNESVVSNRSSINEQGLHGLACGSEETRVHLHGITSSCCVSPGAEGGPVDPLAITAALVLVALGVVCRQRVCRSCVSPGGGRPLAEEESQPGTDPRAPGESGHASSASHSSTMCFIVAALPLRCSTSALWGARDSESDLCI
ncbi:hypothetical protein CgunFtcFv8_006063 [Champsocephalus gunnari]|uniref:Uncharacterized protein n=1 Tax=Champsocephalus gunnari TaxID=52237 RepID=A0AAN8GVQ8_CHAGU|nr:hypothetical protein CgunFtcFv8_006063 [Champsocephalus gunnari]